jgi:hypothetical protein
MNIDLIAAIGSTVSAAIVISALSIGFGSTAAARVRIAVSLSLWFALVVIFGGDASVIL